MANIKKHLDNIKGALYGKDVRSSIHDGIDAINKEVESTTGRQVDLESTFDQLVINAGNSNAEIVDARVKADGTSYTKLGDRLDAVDSQLEQKMNKHYVGYVNVKEFGAKGDGVTDDTQAIQKALDSDYDILFDGVFKVTSELLISKSNKKIIGVGKSKLMYYGEGINERAIVKIFGLDNTQPVENIIINGIFLDATNQEYKGGSSENYKKQTSPNAYNKGLIGIQISYCRNIKISNCVLNDIYGTGIRVNYSTNINIYNNSLYDCSGSNAFGEDSFGDGIVFFSCFNCNASNNTLINKRTYKSNELDYKSKSVLGRICGRSGLEFEYKLDKVWSDSDGANKYCVDYELFNTKKQHGCIFENNYVYGYSKGIHIEADVHAIIKNNTLIHNHIGILSTSGCDGTIIDGNFLDSDNVGYSPQANYGQNYCAIFIGDVDNKNRVFGKTITNNKIFGDSNGINLNGFEAIITNNEFKCYGSPIYRQDQENMSDPTYGYNSQKMIISNNFFEIKENSINLRYGKNIVFSNNIVTGENNGVSSFKIGIKLPVECQNINFKDNIFKSIVIDMIASNFNQDITFDSNQFINTVIKGDKCIRLKFNNNSVVNTDNVHTEFIGFMSGNLRGIQVLNNFFKINGVNYTTGIYIAEATESIDIQNNEIQSTISIFKFLYTNWNITGYIKVLYNIFEDGKILAYLGTEWSTVTTTLQVIKSNVGVVKVKNVTVS